jgi:broad specificity phosphatase PhoE
MQRIVWLRHGRTEWNDRGRFQGQTDIPLDETGHAQAERAADLLVHLRPSAIVSSDLVRAQQTAAPLARLATLETVLDERLRETHAGEWEGLTHAQIRANFGDALDRWSAGEDLRPGGGERRSEVASRVQSAVEDALSLLDDDATLVVVTHGGAARAGIGSMLGLPRSTWSALGVLANCSWSLLAQSTLPPPASAWRLLEYNAGSLPTPVVGDDR